MMHFVTNSNVTGCCWYDSKSSQNICYCYTWHMSLNNIQLYVFSLILRLIPSIFNILHTFDYTIMFWYHKTIEFFQYFPFCGIYRSLNLKVKKLTKNTSIKTVNNQLLYIPLFGDRRVISKNLKNDDVIKHWQRWSISHFEINFGWTFFINKW